MQPRQDQAQATLTLNTARRNLQLCLNLPTREHIIFNDSKRLYYEAEEGKRLLPPNPLNLRALHSFEMVGRDRNRKEFQWYTDDERALELESAVMCLKSQGCQLIDELQLGLVKTIMVGISVELTFLFQSPLASRRQRLKRLCQEWQERWASTCASHAHF